MVQQRRQLMRPAASTEFPPIVHRPEHKVCPLPRLTEPPEKLLDLIYDAATEEELWTWALIQIADMTASLGGFVIGVEFRARLVPFLFNGRMSEESHRTF